MSIENDILQEIDFTDIVTEFSSFKSQKIWCKLLHQTDCTIFILDSTSRLHNHNSLINDD